MPPRLAQNREVRARFWWRFAERAPALYRAINELEKVFFIVQTSKHLCIASLPSSMIYGHKLIVFALQGNAAFAVIQSRLHEVWSRFLGSTMEDRPVYTPDDCLANYPFPIRYGTIAPLADAGEAYIEARAALMVKSGQGLTVTYNRFADPEERAADIIHLRELQAAMDRAVLDAYGWTDLYPVAIHEREWETEEGEHPAPWRLRWPEADRDEVLARLLDLNRRRHEEEEAGIGISPRRSPGKCFVQQAWLRFALNQLAGLITSQPDEAVIWFDYAGGIFSIECDDERIVVSARGMRWETCWCPCRNIQRPAQTPFWHGGLCRSR